MILKLGQTSVTLRIKILDSTSTTGAGKTGLAYNTSGLIISTITNNEASATTYTAAASNIETISTLGTYAAPTSGKCRFKEVDATNHPGIYEIQLADARYAVTNARHLIVSILGASGAAETDLMVEFATVNANLTQIDGNATSGNKATLYLKQLNIQNSAGDSVYINSTSGHGVYCGASAAGKNGFRAISGSSHAMRLEGAASGLSCVGGSGYAGALFEGQGNGAGIDARASGTQPGIKGTIGALTVDIYSELSAAPGTSPTILQKLQWIYAICRNKLDTTSTSDTLYKNDGTSVLGTTTVGDSGSTFTRGRYS